MVSKIPTHTPIHPSTHTRKDSLRLKKHVYYLLLYVFILSCSACANYKTHFSKVNKNWQTQLPPINEQPVYSVYLIGDTGNPDYGEASPVIKLLAKRLEDADENTAVVFLGNSLSENGMAPKLASYERAADEQQLKVQLDAVKNFPGRLFFLPGNQDWDNWGTKGLRRQNRFIENYLDRKKVWEPAVGCGGPEAIELTKDLVLILIDSQWYLQDWDGLPEINQGCDINSRLAFREEFGELLKDYRNKNVIIALHHPLYTYGPHGGQYSAKEHLFPLSTWNKNLLVPLPFVGSAFNFIRSTIGSEQDLSNPRLRELRTSLIGHARKNGHFVFVSGHEQSLQYIERDSQVFIVSGAGSNATAVRNGNGSGFSSGQPGWSKMEYYSDGSAWVSYWVVKAAGVGEELVFRKKIKAASPLPNTSRPDLQVIAKGMPTIKVPISEDNFNRGSLWKFLFGKHYRQVYPTEIEVPFLDLTRYQGGVKPVKQGGGFQTNSLRLENAAGRQFTMRSIDKDATRTVPYPFNQSFAVDLVQDNFSAAHPLAALVIPTLAAAVKVYHTNPTLYYVPRQAALKGYNDDFGNALYLVEERPDDEVWKDADYFGNPKDIVSTKGVLEKIHEDQDSQIDQNWVARSRLFDMLIGDWDRHDDQWRWGLIDSGTVQSFRPIPRDRDQAFSEYDGLVLSFARNAAATAKQWRPYKGNIRPAKWGNYNARHFDPSFTAELSRQDWERAARFIQTQLTDEIIEEAFLQHWPDQVYQISAPKVIRNLKKRRDNLADIARRYYLFQAKKVDVVGTEKRERFEIDRIDGEHTKIRVYATGKEKQPQRLLYERTFLDGETKTINLFGLEGRDTFTMRGTASEGPVIRMIGGGGKDFFTAENKQSSNGKYRIYDVGSEDNQVGAESRAKVLIDDHPIFNTYDRKATDYEYNFSSLLPYASINPDDGILLGLLGRYTTFGFRKAPYASKQTVNLNYSISTEGFRLTYKGRFVDILLKKWDLMLQAKAQTSFYAFNFYGLGNDTSNPEVLENRDRNFNRVLQQMIAFKPLLQRISPFGGWGFGPTYEIIKVDRTPGRFIDEIGDQFDATTFTSQQFAGLRASIEFANLDHPALPAKGISLIAEGGWKYKLGTAKQHFSYFDATFAAYQHIDRQANLVFATQLGVQHRFSNQFEFFQAAHLGGTGTDANFRGLRRNRFAGKTALFQNIDLRWKMLGSQNGGLPFSLGLLGGFDHGRVWLAKDQDISDTWHYSYGGGVWISPFDTFILNFSLFRSQDQQNIFTFLSSYFF